DDVAVFNPAETFVLDHVVADLELRPALRYPRIWRMHHDTGEASMRQVAEGRAELEVSHHMVEHEGFCRVENGHIIKLLQLAGADSATASFRSVATPRSPAIWDITWS
ncbi:MAG: hypothetical protein AAFX50_23305, partial [Acidobacteriota bacterium]